MKARQALDLFSAFICGGFFVALLLLRTEIKRFVVVEDVPTSERQGVASDGKSTTTPAAKIELVARHA